MALMLQFGPRPLEPTDPRPRRRWSLRRFKPQLTAMVEDVTTKPSTNVSVGARIGSNVGNTPTRITLPPKRHVRPSFDAKPRGRRPHPRVLVLVAPYLDVSLARSLATAVGGLKGHTAVLHAIGRQYPHMTVDVDPSQVMARQSGVTWDSIKIFMGRGRKSVPLLFGPSNWGIRRIRLEAPTPDMVFDLRRVAESVDHLELEGFMLVLPGRLEISELMLNKCRTLDLMGDGNKSPLSTLDGAILGLVFSGRKFAGDGLSWDCVIEASTVVLRGAGLDGLPTLVGTTALSLEYGYIATDELDLPLTLTNLRFHVRNRFGHSQFGGASLCQLQRLQKLDIYHPPWKSPEELPESLETLIVNDHVVSEEGIPATLHRSLGLLRLKRCRFERVDMAQFALPPAQVVEFYQCQSDVGIVKEEDVANVPPGCCIRCPASLSRVSSISHPT